MDQEHSMKSLGIVSYASASPDDGNMEDRSYGNRDDLDMAKLGKKQQLRRNFGFMSMLGFTCTLMCTWEGLLCVFAYGLANGGTAGLIYGYISCWIGYLAVAASMAEMASMAPTSGGQYHWTFMLAPPSSAKFLSYVTGWVSMIGWQACTASGAFLGGTIIQGLIVLNYPDYNFQRWHGTLMFYAIIALTLFVNTYLASYLPKIEGLILVLHILGFFAILIPIVYLAPRSSASEVFGTFINGGGWNSEGLSFFVGIIASVYAFIGADGAAHMAEEVQNASTIVPWSMIFTILLNGSLGFGMLIAVSFCIGNIDDALNTPTGFPFIEIFAQATRSITGSTIMTSIIIVLVISATIGLLAASSRVMWAFARDNGLPGSTYLARVEPRTQLPLYAIGLTTIISLLLALINIASTAAFNAIISLVVAGFLTSYLTPIILILHKRLGGGKVAFGPWKLGSRFGAVVNVVAIVYIIIAMFFSFWPGTAVVTPANMNWSILLFGVVMMFSMVFYLVHGRKSYKGPVVEVWE